MNGKTVEAPLSTSGTECSVIEYSRDARFSQRYAIRRDKLTVGDTVLRARYRGRTIWGLYAGLRCELSEPAGVVVKTLTGEEVLLPGEIRMPCPACRTGGKLSLLRDVEDFAVIGSRRETLQRTEDGAALRALVSS